MTALSRAQQVQPGSTVRWDRIERDAFASRPEVVGPAPAEPRKLVAKDRWLMGVGLLVAAVVFGSPIWGYVAVAADGSRFATAARDSDPGSTIPVAGAFFGCALVALLAMIVTWFVRGRRKAAGPELGFASLTLVLGSMTALSVWRRGESAGVDDWQLWIIPIIVATVVGGVHALVLLISRLRHEANSRLSFADADLLELRRERAAELDSAEQAAIRADLEAAITDLEQRGLISGTVAERARRAELGALALAMRS